ncbi:hypothetical protein NM688_g5848 [Phlebia brevispora]|uniref:Uncharacterized protein n=1 Tax=Phlebia brevispora TaxID=194682 RepID=A0ACC1SNT3_9APHY|nr:hypothetical protein NM688_g5848 [Phlebia brevispora]
MDPNTHWSAFVQTRSTVHPYTEEDLRNATAIPLESWINGVFGMTAERMNDWTQTIREQNWFADEVVQESLRQYAIAWEEYGEESGRYASFVDLVNRIVVLGRGNLPGLKKQYPLDDFVFADNHGKTLESNREQEGLGVRHGPRVLGLRRKKAKQLTDSDGTVKWTDVMLCLELKYQLNLSNLFNAEKKKRGIEPNGAPKKTRRGRAKKQAASSAADDINTANPAYLRLPRRKEDLLAETHKYAGWLTLNKTGETLDAGTEVSIRAASHALEVLSATHGSRAFCLNAIVKDDFLSLWYYDACGVVYTTERLSLLTHFERFAAIVVGFAQCTPEQFGTIPASVLRPRIPYRRNFPPQDLSDFSLRITDESTEQEVEVTLGEPLFAQYALTGRRTFLYTAETDPIISGRKSIVKFSYQVSTRQSEHELVKIARKARVRHIPEVHISADVWKMSEGVRRVFFQDQEYGYEDRTLRCIVYRRYNSIKPLFAVSCELIPVMVHQMLNCLDDLWTKARMLHRDVSVDNIMYEKRGDYYHFVLIDFDMAIVLSEDDSSCTTSSRQLTGTLPFIATEIIYDYWLCTYKRPDSTPIQRLLRHDFESLFWVSLWCILMLLSSTVSAEEARDLRYWPRSWESGDLDAIGGRRGALCTMGLHKTGITLPGPAQCLRRWFNVWTENLKKIGVCKSHDTDASDSGESKQVRSVDWETIGGRFAKTTLQAALLEAFPIPEPYLAAPKDDGDKLDEQGPEDGSDGPKNHTPDDDGNEPMARATDEPVTVDAAPEVVRPRKKAKTSPLPAAAPENDIRSRLRPRRSRI